MKYEIREQHSGVSFIDAILLNRGIEHPSEYKNLDDSYLHSYTLLANIGDAVKMLMHHIENKSDIGIIVDSDCDGYCSASMLYMYLIQIYNKDKISYYIHEGKQHGLSNDISLNENKLDLLIVPDGGTNDSEQCNRLKANGIDVIILDHHQVEKSNPSAIVVNPQNCNYPNKHLSGGGVVYKFLKALDAENWNEYADHYLDLVALSTIGDSMTMTDYENKRLVDMGLFNINNSFIKALVQKQSYSMNDKINIISFQYYIVPLINGLIRAGTQEEKLLMFEAFINSKEMHDYKKRGSNAVTQETTQIKTARLCTNAKAKQNRVIDKAIKKLDEKIIEKGWDKNQVMFINADDVNKKLTGLIAMKLASKYNKPCLLLRENKQYSSFSGSGRNIDCDIVSLKDFLAETKLFNFLQGHDSAFGVGIKRVNVRSAIKHINEKLTDFDFAKTHLVDFVFNFYDINFDTINDICEAESYYGQGIEQCLVLVENANIIDLDIEVIGKNENTIRFENDEGVVFIKFRCGEDDVLRSLLSTVDDVSINIIGKPTINEYKGIETPQIIIKDLEIVQKD